jgi:myb proto-oncogene protein
MISKQKQQCRQRWVTLDPTIEHMDNKGKWTVAEDAKLTEAVTEFGNDWVRVAALVPGRTNARCRQSLDPGFKKGIWTVAEDAKLAELVTELGTDWVRVAAMVPGRTNIQCRRRWFESLDPTINRGVWTVEEDAALTEGVKEHGSNWIPVAAMIPGRTKKQCCQRWQRYLRPGH